MTKAPYNKIPWGGSMTEQNFNLGIAIANVMAFDLLSFSESL